MVSSSIHVRPPGSSLVPPITPTVKHRRQIALPASVNRVHEPAIVRTTKAIRAEVLPLLYAPGTPTSYTFHSCSTSLTRKTLHRIHAQDIPLKFHLNTLIFSLPKELDDNGLAITWLVSLTICLAWCLHATSSDPKIVITEPELRVGDPYVAVNETQSSSLPLKRAEFTIATNALPRGTDAGLATTATELVTSFLEFTSGLPTEEMDTEEQVVFAFADFLHAREDKCKNCILWRSVWKECLRRIYGAEVVKSMAKERKPCFEKVFKLSSMGNNVTDTVTRQDAHLLAIAKVLARFPGLVMECHPESDQKIIQANGRGWCKFPFKDREAPKAENPYKDFFRLLNNGSIDIKECEDGTNKGRWAASEDDKLKDQDQAEGEA